MSTASHELLSLALSLPDADRLAIAEELFISVRRPGVMSVDDPGFADEIRRRSEEVKAGTAVLVDYKTAFTHVRQVVEQARRG